MTLIITKSINPDDQQELFAGLRQYNQQYLDAAQFGDLGIYSRDAQGVMQGGLIVDRLDAAALRAGRADSAYTRHLIEASASYVGSAG